MSDPRNINAAPGDKVTLGGFGATITRMGVETQGADPPVVHYTTPKSLRVWDERQEGSIIGVGGFFLEGSWVRIAAPRLAPDRHFRWLGLQLFRGGSIASGSNLLQQVLGFAIDAIPLPRVGDVRLPYMEMATDLVGSFVQYRIATWVWGEWSGNPGIVEEDRVYGGTYSEIKVTLIGHFE